MISRVEELSFVVFVSQLVRKPLTRMVELMRANLAVPPTGAAELRFVAETYNDVSEENRKTHEQLSHAASHDALTGLYNRGAYEMLMEGVDHEHIALLLIDVDRFKSINDTYGHDVGDRVLVETAKVLSAHVRLGDTVGRWGGEEFLMVLLETDEKKALQIAESIRKDIAALRILPRGKGFTASFGVARIAPRETFDTFYQRVDRALYRAKHGGKNRVCLDE